MLSPSEKPRIEAVHEAQHRTPRVVALSTAADVASAWLDSRVGCQDLALSSPETERHRYPESLRDVETY
jgi:hypothetical protein